MPRARRSARKSKASRAACALVGKSGLVMRPALGRSRSASTGPRGSPAISTIAFPRGPNPNRCSARAASAFGSTAMISPACRKPKRKTQAGPRRFPVDALELSWSASAEAAEKEAASRRATDAQVLEDAERVIAAWNERQAKRMPMLFSPTIGVAITAGYWFLWVRCPTCRMINAIDLRGLDRHPDAAVSSLIPALSCRSCRPNAPFADLVRLSRTSIADEMREEHRRRVLGE